MEPLFIRIIRKSLIVLKFFEMETKKISDEIKGIPKKVSENS